MLPKDPSGKVEKEAIERVIRKFPQLIEYYIRYKEDRGDEAVSVSNARVEESEIVFVQQVSQFVHTLASGPQLRCNLRKQVELYKSASDANHGIKVIAYFSARELAKLNGILNEIGLQGDPNVILIDANKDNKPSASKA